MGRRFVVLALVSLLAVALISSASAALFFLFKPTSADAGDVVTVRLGGTPANFTLDQRERPFRNGIRLYLVPSSAAGDVESRFDSRVHFIGRIVPDRKGRGVLSFTVPPLDTGPYALASWWYRPWMGLQVRLPSAAEVCPVSDEGTYGNGLLSTWVPPGGILPARTDADGLFQKLGWLPHRGFPDALAVRGERLDAPSPPMRVLGVYWGHASSGPAAKGSWASAVKFPSEGCWRITGRVQDVTLSYVVKVVAAP
jgi:hypothetical protein